MADRQVEVTVSVGDAYVSLTAANSTYAPDVLHDMTRRAAELLINSMSGAIAVGYVEQSETGYEEEVEVGTEDGD